MRVCSGGVAVEMTIPTQSSSWFFLVIVVFGRRDPRCSFSPPRAGTMGEGAAIYNCILCDSYALITLGVLPDRKLARGIKGKAAYEDLLESFQESHASPARCHLLACPTCNAHARQDDAAPPGEIVLPDQMEQGRFAREGLAVLTPRFLVAFEEGELPPYTPTTPSRAPSRSGDSSRE